MVACSALLHPFLGLVMESMFILLVIFLFYSDDLSCGSGVYYVGKTMQPGAYALLSRQIKTVLICTRQSQF